MRIHIKTTPSKNKIDFNYQYLLTGVLHKWMGNNELHDKMSLYSFSGLTQSEVNDKKLCFPHGTTFNISCWDNQQLKRIIDGIQQEPELFSGMKVEEIVLEENPDFSSQEYFYLGSPVFIQRRIENNEKKFYLYSDEQSSSLLEETIIHKMREANLIPDPTLKIFFDKEYYLRKTKLIHYKHREQVFKIRANWCPVIIKGANLTKQFIWNVGLGNSTGIGFGAIK